ncbi:MAG: inorganic phosphate transporter [Oscillospiraceae bacterium]|nr:inorganic phosphate transporter [Oscillospiraceae bacterium]
MDSILVFWNQMTANPLLFVAVTLTLGVILVNGWTDAPNAIASCVVTRCMSPRAAILMAALFNFLGVFVMTRINNEVAVTITSMVNFGDNAGSTVIIVLCAAMLAIVIWATLAWVFGIPTSESHALIAGLTGGAMALEGVGAIVWSQWVKVLYGIIISVALGFGLAWLVCKLVTAIFRKANRPKTEPFFRFAQIIGSAGMAFMHGAQDGQKFMGIILLCVFTLQGSGAAGTSFEIPTWLMILCSIVMGAGTAMGGKKIIKSVGMDMVKLEKYQGFSADLASSLSLVFCSVFGLPVSTTHAKTTAIMGVGAVKRVSAINFGVVKEMVLTWILTFPGCGLLAFLVTKLFLLIFN